MTGHSDGALIVWNAVSGEEISRWDEPERVSAIAFHPGGKLAAIAVGAVARVTAWHPDTLIGMARQVLSRNLTPQEWNLYFGAEPYRKSSTAAPD
jgi:hypothetical protein